MTVGSVVHGSNADLIAAVAALYLRDGATVADITYGHGVFWRKVPPRYRLLASDIAPRAGHVLAADFRDLPYGNASVDVVAFDPPYVHHGTPLLEGWYRGSTTAALNHDGILKLYRDGMAEAVRVLRSGGSLWVKCQDEIESGVQRWSHVEIRDIAADFGLYAHDLFVLVPTSQVTTGRWASQHHARKRHSYLWVFSPSRNPTRNVTVVTKVCCCGATISQGKLGRPRTHCSPACRTRAYRSRNLKAAP